ncbi:leucine-rich repeat transmembrane protein FLRT2 [Denticeps clupeoides]|uniref:Fibronectin type-III domain-containing protein n=1 Tax=Denticeps clupeoides TaxID=299321 RepID=A0AAY4ARQ9_9TELE|nr:leucine-rich repeat transmembrane protein FLRT2-like [Denticeps clupeoides]
MDLQVRIWNKDLAVFLRPWMPIMLGLHMQLVWSTSCPEECRCDGTFVYCNERSLTSVPLGIGEGYKILYLHNNQINNAGFPSELHAVSSVETVYLYGNQLDEFPSNLPKNVRVLHLQENNIQTISRAALAQLQWLEELYLDDNSISTVGVEEGAFREAVSLKILFLTKNHLSSVPIGLPADLKELRLDENRIAVISEEAFQNVTSLERLLLDGNLLVDEGISRGAFQSLVNLRTLSLARNSLTAPPSHLPSDFLLRLNLQDNQMNEIPVRAFSGLRRLERLDVSNNQLQALTQGVFDGLLSLRQLTVRNNLWLCDCSIEWVILWLKSLPAALNVRGFMCQKPDRLRGMVIRELNLDLIQCPRGAATVPALTRLPASPSSFPTDLGAPRTESPPVHEEAPGANDPKRPMQETLHVSFSVLNQSCVQVSWASAFAVAAYKVTWAKVGFAVPGGGARETVVQGSLQGIKLLDLEPKSTYHICVVPLDAHDSYRPGDDTICSEVTTRPVASGFGSNAVGPEQATQRDPSSPLLLAGLIGGSAFLVLVLLLSLVCCHMHKRGSSVSSRWKYNRGRRKEDYCEAGTKKDPSILEMTESSFQIMSLNNEQVFKGPYHIQPSYTTKGGFPGAPPEDNRSTYTRNNVHVTERSLTR